MEPDKTVNDDVEVTQNDQETTEETTETTNEGETITLTKAELEEKLATERKQQDKRWKERLKGFEETKEKPVEPKVTSETITREELDRFRLENKGIETKEAQDFILKYAKLEGISVPDALNDEVVKAKLERMTIEAEKGRATQSPVNRTAKPREKTIEEVARQWEEKGERPNSPEARKKALKAIQEKYK